MRMGWEHNELNFLANVWSPLFLSFFIPFRRKRRESLTMAMMMSSEKLQTNMLLVVLYKLMMMLGVGVFYFCMAHDNQSCGVNLWTVKDTTKLTRNFSSAKNVRKVSPWEPFSKVNCEKMCLEEQKRQARRDLGEFSFERFFWVTRDFNIYLMIIDCFLTV